MTHTPASSRATGAYPHPMLDSRYLLLTRGETHVQLGWGPDTAHLLTPPPGTDVATTTQLLKLLDGSRTRAQVLFAALSLGVRYRDSVAVLNALRDARLLRDGAAVRRTRRPRRVRIHGRGPVADCLLAQLRASGIRVFHSYGPTAEIARRWRAEFVVITDDLVVDPALAAELVRAQIPHLPVRLRDGHGVVGPLVLPGQTSCLRCADLLRRELDPDWPRMSAQLLGRIGSASPATVTATAAVALEQIAVALRGDTETPPRSLGTTLEIDLELHEARVRHWPPHPACSCGSAGRVLPDDSERSGQDQ